MHRNLKRSVSPPRGSREAWPGGPPSGSRGGGAHVRADGTPSHHLLAGGKANAGEDRSAGQATERHQETHKRENEFKKRPFSSKADPLGLEHKAQWPSGHTCPHAWAAGRRRVLRSRAQELLNATRAGACVQARSGRTRAEHARARPAPQRTPDGAHTQESRARAQETWRWGGPGCFQAHVTRRRRARG